MVERTTGDGNRAGKADLAVGPHGVEVQRGQRNVVVLSDVGDDLLIDLATQQQITPSATGVSIALSSAQPSVTGAMASRSNLTGFCSFHALCRNCSSSCCCESRLP